MKVAIIIDASNAGNLNDLYSDIKYTCENNNAKIIEVVAGDDDEYIDK